MQLAQTKSKITLNNENLPYPLEWLDILVTITFNPHRTDVASINNDQLDYIINRIPEENLRLQSLIKSQIFSSNNEICYIKLRWSF